VENDRSDGVGLIPLLFGCISPVADVSLFVNEETAHPSIWLPTPGCGVLILVVGADEESAEGSAVSGSVAAYFRTRSK
jgi:hypothetical protein